MADDASLSLKGRVSAEEWQARVDCAALYRLVALHGWDDLIFTHISMRVPGPEHHFLINPYGMLFEEITASSLVKVDLDGNIVAPTSYFINPAGLQAQGQNIYLETAASGSASSGAPGANGLGTVSQGYVETSNVNVVEELVSMIQTQRAYEINSKSIQSSDQMLQRLSQL